MSSKEFRIKFVEMSPEYLSIKAELKPGTMSHDIYFRSHDIPLIPNNETLLTAALLPCMKTGSALVADGIISQRLLNARDPIFNFLCTLNPSLKRVEIKNLIPEPKKPPKENRVGTFFSGGLDSFYTLLKHRDEITDLIFIDGFDIGLDDHLLRRKTADVIRETGLRFGKRVIMVETNLRSFHTSHLKWLHTHGAALASIGHLLSPHFTRIYISSSVSAAYVIPPFLGSHPALDPLWSTETLEFVHDGCEVTRVDKAALIAESDLALKSLRVCCENPNSVYNCGRCEKCIRTMINLHSAGALDRCTSFENKLDTKALTRFIGELAIRDIGMRAYVEENLKALEKSPDNRELYNALRKCFKRSWWLTPGVQYPRLYRLYQIRWIYRTLRSLGKLFE